MKRLLGALLSVVWLAVPHPSQAQGMPYSFSSGTPITAEILNTIQKAFVDVTGGSSINQKLNSPAITAGSLVDTDISAAKVTIGSTSTYLDQLLIAIQNKLVTLSPGGADAVTPVQLATGPSQYSNTVSIGWGYSSDTSSGMQLLRYSVDNVDKGYLANEADLQSLTAALTTEQTARSNGDSALQKILNTAVQENASSGMTGVVTLGVNTSSKRVTATDTTGTQTVLANYADVTNIDSSKQAVLGFTPVQQGTGPSQSGNTLSLGWGGSGTTNLRYSVDGVDHGLLANMNDVSMVSGALNTEQSNRSSADSTLQTNITAEANTRSVADVALSNDLQNKVDVTGGSSTNQNLNTPKINGGSITGIPCYNSLSNSVCTVNDNDDLTNLSTGSVSSGTIVERLGFYSAGDGGLMKYTASGTSCSLNGGSGDNGSQVKSADGKCWIWVLDSHVIPLEVFGGDKSASRDDTAFTNEISAIQNDTQGRGVIFLGIGTYNISRSITVNGPTPVNIEGTDWMRTIIRSSNGSGYNLISWGNTGPSDNQTQGGSIRSLALTVGDGATGGWALESIHTANFIVRDVMIYSYFGIHDEQSNNNLYDNIWGYTVGTGGQVFLMDVTPDTQNVGGRTDQVTINNMHINAGFYGNDCFVMRGMVQTLNMYNNTFMQCHIGFFVDASQNTRGDFPQFGFIYNMQIEGCVWAGVEIDGGREFHFTDSTVFEDYGETGSGGTQGNSDIAGLYIQADSARSVTSDISWKGGWVGGGAQWAAIIIANGVRLSNMAFRDSSKSSPGEYGSLNIRSPSGDNSSNYQIDDVKFCGLYGEPLDDGTGLYMDSGVGNTIVTNADFSGCQKYNVRLNGGTRFVMTAAVLNNGNLITTSTSDE